MSTSVKRHLQTTALAAVVGITCFVLLLALPPVQARLTHSIINRIDGIELELGHVWATPWSIEIEDLQLRLEGTNLSLDLDRADLNLAFWSSLFDLRLDIESALLIGVDLVIEPTGQAARETQTDRVSFTGLGPAARIPGWLTLDRLDASGNLLIRPSADIELIAPWALRGTSLIPDTMATIDLTASFEAQRAGESFAAAELRVDASAAIDAAARLKELTLAAQIDPVEDLPGLRVRTALAIGEAGEHYRIDLEGRAGDQLAHLDALLRADGGIDGDWELSLAPGVIAAFARGRSVADVFGHSTGRVQADLTGASAQFESSTELTGRGWEALDPRLTRFGTLGMTLVVDGALEPGLITVETVDVAISSAEHGELLSIEALQPLRYSTGDWLVDPEIWGEPALRIEASGLPLRWLGQLSEKAIIERGEFSGALELVRREERHTDILVTEPLRAANVQLAPIGGIALPEIEVSLAPHATLSNGALDAEINQLTLSAATGFRVVFEGSLTTSRTLWPLSDFSGNFTANVPALTRLVPQLDSVYGATRMQFDFDRLLLTVATAAVGADTVDGRELMNADLSGQEPLRIQLPHFAPDWDDFEAQSASLRLDRVPIDWVSPYIPELEFRGGEVSGRFEAAGVSGNGLILETPEPLIITNLLPIYRGLAAHDPWTASVRPTVRLSTAASTVTLEDFSIVTNAGNELRASLTVEAPANSDQLAMSFAFDGDVAELADRYGLRISRLHWRHSGQVDLSREHLTLDELSIDIEDSAGTDVLLLESLRPFTITTEPFGVAVDGGSADIIRASVTPLTLERLLPNIFGLGLEGTLPEGEFFGRAEPDGTLVLAADDPLVFSDVTVRWDDATLLDRVTASIQYEVAYSADGLEARSVDLMATGADGLELLHATTQILAPLNNERLLSKAQLTLEAHLAPLTSQPVLAELPHFSGGVVEASLTFVEDLESSLALTASLRDAISEVTGELPDFDLMMEASGVRGERLNVTMPLQLQSEAHGASDLRLDGFLSLGAGGLYKLDASISSEQLVVNDLEQLVALGLSPEPLPPAAETGGLAPLSEETLSAIAKLRAERHEIPIWTDRLLARTTLDLGRVRFPSFDVEDVRGRLEITENRAQLADVHAALLGAELNAAASVNFDVMQAKPYSLGFRAEIDQFELDRLFLAVAPERTPTAEGHFRLTSTLTGTGLNPLDLGLSTLGELRLKGSDGIYRGLAAHEGIGSTAARVIGILTFSRELRAIGRLLDRLGEIRFREAEFLLERSAPDHIDVSTFFVRAPQLTIDARGSLALAPQRPLLLSPIDVSAQIAATGDMAILFDGMGLLEEETSDAGYRDLTRIIRVGGTPIQPDTSDFWELLEEAANNSRGAFGAGLRALNRRLEYAGK